MSFSQLADMWQLAYGQLLASARDDVYRLKQINEFPASLHRPVLPFGDLPTVTVTILDIEQYRDHRKTAGLSAVRINQDLRLVRKIFNRGIRKGLTERTPCKFGTEAAIRLEREIPRHRSFDDPHDEDRLLAASAPHLHAVIIALLETACRVGEVLSLQWADVSIDRRELTVRAEKAKTRTALLVPKSSLPDGCLGNAAYESVRRALRAYAFVFGDEIGQRVKTVRRAWVGACQQAGLKDLQLRDLRHEAGSRFDEAASR